MIPWAVLLTAAAFFQGAALLFYFFRWKNSPAVLKCLHGLAGLAGVGALLAAVFLAGYGLPVRIVTVFFISVGVGGITILVFRLRSKSPPPLLVLIHAVLGMAAFVLILAC